MNSKFNKLIDSPEAHLKYKKQCLKNKNILFENDSVQIGCKIIPFYDFFLLKIIFICKCSLVIKLTKSCKDLILNTGELQILNYTFKKRIS